MSGSLTPFLRTIRWRRLVVAVVVFAAWHGVLQLRVRWAAAELRRTGWPASRRALAAGFAAGQPATNLPAAIAGLAFELRGAKPEVVPSRERDPNDGDADASSKDFHDAEGPIPRFTECGRAGIIANPLPFLRYTGFRNSVDNHAGVLAGLARVRGLSDLRPPRDLVRDGNPQPEWLVGLTDLATLVQLQALVAARDGAHEVAATAIGDILMIARSLSEFPDPAIQERRDRIVGIASRTTAMVASATRLTDAEWASIESEFAREGESRSYGIALRGCVAEWADDATHRVSSAGRLMRQATGTSEPRGFPFAILVAFQWASGLHAIDRRQTLEGLVAGVRAIGAVGDGLPPEADAPSNPSAGGEFSDALGWVRPGAAAAWSAITRAGDGRRAALADARLGALVCAIERHRLAHGGELPVELYKIDPALLPDGGIPEDPYTGCPLEFRRQCSTYRVNTALEGSDLQRTRGRAYHRESMLRFDDSSPAGGWWGALIVQFD